MHMHATMVAVMLSAVHNYAPVVIGATASEHE